MVIVYCFILLLLLYYLPHSFFLCVFIASFIALFTLLYWWWSRDDKWKIAPITGAIIVIFSIIMLGCASINIIFYPPSSSTTITQNEKSLPTFTIEEKNEPPLPEYSIYDEEIYDAPIKTQIFLKVLVRGDTSKEDIENLLNHLYNLATTKRKFIYHNPPTNITIQAYNSKEKAKSGQWIMILLDHHDIKPKIMINERQVAQINAIPEKRFGLSEIARKRIWKDYMLLVQFAEKSAEKQYPIDILMKNLQEGETFQLSSKIALMPKLNPIGVDDTIISILNAQTIPSGYIIKILRVADKDGVPWYYVDVMNSVGFYIDSGWINSMALIGQNRDHYDQQLENQYNLRIYLVENCKNEITKKYGISQDQLKEIISEAINKDWAFPQ